MSLKTTKSMKWHDEGHTKDRKLRHPTDWLAWKIFDSLHLNFALDPRNVRLKGKVGSRSKGWMEPYTLFTTDKKIV